MKLRSAQEKFAYRFFFDVKVVGVESELGRQQLLIKIYCGRFTTRNR